MAFTRKTDSGGGEVVKFVNVGDKVTGVYVGSQPHPEGKFGPSVKYIFNTKAGMRVAFAKEGGQIGNLLAGEDGKLVCLTFSGTKNTGKGNPMKLFTLDVDADYVASEEELSAGNDEPEDDEDGPAMDEKTTAAAKAAPRAAPPSAAKRSQVNAFVSNRK